MDAQRLAGTARGWVSSVTRRARDAASAVTGPADLDELLADPGLVTALERYAAEHDLPIGQVRAEAAEHLREMAAVSYTHLDVYKRQSQDFTSANE